MTGERPRIGEFSKTPSKPVAQEHPVPEAAPPTEPPVPESKDQPTGPMPPETETEKMAQERMGLYAKMQAALVPVRDYRKFLKEQGITEEEASTIVDDLVTKGFHQEEMPITKKVSVTLRTRRHEDMLRLQSAMRIQQPIYNDSFDELTTRYNMAASLAKYGEDVFEHAEPNADESKQEELFDKRLKYVEQLAGPVFTIISTKLSRFDWKVMAVMQDGVAENF